MSTKTDFSDATLSADADAALDELTQAKDAERLIAAWVTQGNAAAVQEAAEHATGKARTAARRGLNVLKSRGVTIPARRKPSAGSALALPAEALMVPPDGSGSSLFVVYKPAPSGRCASCFVTLVQGRGVLRVERGESTPSKLRAALSRGTGLGSKAVAVPVGWARFRIAEARKAHQSSGSPEPLGFDSSKDLLEPIPETAPEHPFDAEGFEFADEDARDMASDSGALHHLPEFASWLPSQAAVGEMLRDVGTKIAAETPDAEPEQSRVSEFLKGAMLDATDRYFDEVTRKELMSRMKDMGLSILAHHGEAQALKLAATIQVIGAAGLVTNPPRDVAFLRAFFEKAIAILSMQQNGQLKIPMPARPAASPAPAEATG
jgi:hypothetical protein